MPGTRSRRRSAKMNRPSTPLVVEPDPDLLLMEQEDPALVYLAELISGGKNIVFLTGAGISKASGIATYRGETHI